MKRSACLLQIDYRRFEERRKKLGLTVRDVAREAQLNASNVYALVRPPSARVRKRIAAVLAVDEAELFIPVEDA